MLFNALQASKVVDLDTFRPVRNRASRRSAGQVRARRIGTLTARGALRVKPLEQVAAERALRLASRKLDRAGA